MPFLFAYLAVQILYVLLKIRPLRKRVTMRSRLCFMVMVRPIVRGRVFSRGFAGSAVSHERNIVDNLL